MKVGTVFFILLLVFALVGSIGGTAYYYSNAVGSVQGQVYEHLESIAQSRASHVETFLDERMLLAENLALIGKVKELLLEDGNYNAKKLLLKRDCREQLIQLSRF